MEHTARGIMVVCSTLVLCMAFVGSASAGAREYACTVKQVMTLSAEGQVVEATAFADYVGKDFRIHRETGVITSAVPFSRFEQVRVLFSGSTGHALIGLAEESGPGPRATLIEINEVVSGVLKPFLWHTSGAILYAGTCL